MKEAAVAYSGGTDSTCAAALLLDRFERVTLLTYSRPGLFSPENSERNVRRLVRKYGGDRVTHRIIPLNRLYDFVSDDLRFHYMKKYGFLNLGGCGVCKLTIHLRTLVWCLDHGITSAADGSTRDLYLFPTQMEPVNREVKKMYSRFGLVYETPVYDTALPENSSLWDKILRAERLSDESGSPGEKGGESTGVILYRLGLMPAPNVKGTLMDRHMQSRCYQ
ncbi:MAG TPA: hypothetical protein VJC03_07805, partial [bacterium]|nr:hypothetical protein [bacterium]